MPLDYPNWGAGDVPSYQLSGVPFVTSSNGAEVSTTPIRVQLPGVSRFLVIKETEGQDLRVGFSVAGVNGTGGVSGSVPTNPAGGESAADRRNYFVVEANTTSPRLEIRCKTLYFRRDGASDAGFSLIAGITPIATSQFPPLTGSAGYDGIG